MQKYKPRPWACGQQEPLSPYEEHLRRRHMNRHIPNQTDITQEEYDQIKADGSFHMQRICSECGLPITHDSKPLGGRKDKSDRRCWRCVEIAEESAKLVKELAAQKIVILARKKEEEHQTAILREVKRKLAVKRNNRVQKNRLRA